MSRIFDLFRQPLTIGTLCVLVAGAVMQGCSNDDPVVAGATGLASTNQVTQIDRAAIPLANQLFISAANRDAFNGGDPTTDAATFRAAAIQIVTAFRAAVNALPGVNAFPAEDAGETGIDPAEAVDLVLPDVLAVDFSRPLQFPNGRQLQDDVVDIVLGIFLNRGRPLDGGRGVPDNVASDSVFLGTFPYLGNPR